ncbi:MAG: hypothetical protein K2X08_06930, partial [Chlamydiales bacterium]|nr:hypothetical protein [Chlamydiales bacterium]
MTSSSSSLTGAQSDVQFSWFSERTRVSKKHLSGEDFPISNSLSSIAMPIIFNTPEYNPNSLEDSLNFLNAAGRHTRKSPVVGLRAEDLLAVKKAMSTHRVLAELETAIYQKKFLYLIPDNKKEEADSIAREIFLDYIAKYASHGCTEQNIVKWSKVIGGATSSKTIIHDSENEYNIWSVETLVGIRSDKDNGKNGYYFPRHVAAYHELMHVEEIMKKASSAFEKEPGNELLTTIKTIVILDVIYKKVCGLDENVEIDYNKNIEIDGKLMSLGRFANFYREQEKKFGKLYLALISP